MLYWLCCCDPDWNFKRRAVAKTLLGTSSRTHCADRSLQTFLREKGHNLCQKHFCLFCCPCVCCSVKNKGMIGSTGKPILHKDKVLPLLDAIALVQKLAICKCATRTTGTDACQQMCRWSSKASCSPEAILDHNIFVKMQRNTPQKNQKYISRKTQPDGVWRWQTNKPILPQSLFGYASFLWHGPTHVSTYSFTNYSKKLHVKSGHNTITPKT